MKNANVNSILLTVFGVLFFVGCAHQPRHHSHAGTSEDGHQWLEEIEGAKALEWVRGHNDKTLMALEKNPLHSRLEAQARRILLAEDRIPVPRYRNGYVYNFWQDKKNVRGLWRRTTLAQYANPQPAWETVLDLDALARAEKENWVWKQADCLAPSYDRCMIALSRGGKDAVVLREFDVRAKRFVGEGEGQGFAVKEAKMDFAWLNRDGLLIATDYGEGSLTLSGYPRILKLWKRGTDLARASTVLEVPREYMGLSVYTFLGIGGSVTLVEGMRTFFEAERYVLDSQHEKLRRYPVPDDAVLKNGTKDKLVFQLRSDWNQGEKVFPAGSLIAVAAAYTGAEPALVEQIFVPDERSAVEDVEVTRDALLVTVMHNVATRVLRFTHDGQAWVSKPLRLPDNGHAAVVSSDPFSDIVLTTFENFLIPPTVFHNGKVLRRLPPRFAARGLKLQQFEAVSSDGTKVPYFIVHNAAMKTDGANPVLMYGYGGFQVPILPGYASIPGKLWLERGGVYVVANIRGGGEFGPKWHQAALKGNRQKAFDDFAAVARDLIARKITNPAKLGIYGGSNGGLLVGASITQHPELFGAAVCKVPLLDMLRFHQLLAGHSWTAEYGDPGNPEDRAAIAKYSPYHHVKSGVRYPKVFFLTSTKDDRVHPGHARKMVARMEELGHPVFYYENIEGGHGAAANLEQKIKMTALEYTYLSQQLGVH